MSFCGVIASDVFSTAIAPTISPLGAACLGLVLSLFLYVSIFAVCSEMQDDSSEVDNIAGALAASSPCFFVSFFLLASTFPILDIVNNWEEFEPLTFCSAEPVEGPSTWDTPGMRIVSKKLNTGQKISVIAPNCEITNLYPEVSKQYSKDALSSNNKTLKFYEFRQSADAEPNGYCWFNLGQTALVPYLEGYEGTYDSWGIPVGDVHMIQSSISVFAAWILSFIGFYIYFQNN